MDDSQSNIFLLLPEHFIPPAVVAGLVSSQQLDTLHRYHGFLQHLARHPFVAPALFGPLEVLSVPTIPDQVPNRVIHPALPFFEAPYQLVVGFLTGAVQPAHPDRPDTVSLRGRLRPALLTMVKVLDLLTSQPSAWTPVTRRDPYASTTVKYSRSVGRGVLTVSRTQRQWDPLPRIYAVQYFERHPGRAHAVEEPAVSFVSEMRLKMVDGVWRTEVDFAVRELAWIPNPDSRYPNEIVLDRRTPSRDVFDAYFGANCHHVELTRSQGRTTLHLVQMILERLNIGFLFTR
jgi:hypothetical protein